MRLRQQDEKPGSVVTFADVRYATTGIDVTGLPNNTPLTGTAGEDKTANDTSSAAQQLGNLLAIDRNTISVAGDMSSATDVDWYEFEVDYEQIQVLEGVNDGTKSWATTFDIDFGSGVRGDYTISVFDADTNELIYVGRDSNIADDLPDPSQGDTDADDLTRGSAGVNDPFIGTVQLTEGTYYVAVSTNAQLPNQLDQNFVSAATNPEVRLEPLSSLNRIVDDKIGSTGYFQEAGFFDQPAQNEGRSVISTQDGFALQANVQPFTLADMTVFITEGGGNSRLRTINPFTGVADSQPGGYTYAANQSAADLDMLSDGRLVVYMNEEVTRMLVRFMCLIQQQVVEHNCGVIRLRIARQSTGNGLLANKWKSRCTGNRIFRSCCIQCGLKQCRVIFFGDLLCCLGRQCFKTVWRANERRCVIEYCCTTCASIWIHG